MNLQESESPNESSQQGSTDGGGEGRSRRRRRRGRRPGDGPRPEGSEADATQAPSQRQATQQTAPRADAPRADAPNGAAEGGEAAGAGDSEGRRRRRKRPRPQREGAPEQAAAPAEGAKEEPQKDRPNPRDRQRREPEKKERAPRGSVLQRRVNRGDYVDAPRVKEEPVPTLAPVNAVTVDGYIAHHKGWQREVLTTLRGIIKNVASDIEEGILWSQPVFSMNGPVCYLKAFTDHVNFGFWRGTELADSEGLLTGDLTKMRHITLQSTADVKRDVFEAMVREAIKLNRDKGDPTLS